MGGFKKNKIEDKRLKFKSLMKIIAGVDEVGRGSLIGPVYAAAVILNRSVNYKILKDSKTLTKEKREILFNYIKKNSIWATGRASVKEIDKINILQASLLAMKRAIKKLKKKPSQILIDGNKIPDLKNYNLRAIVKGDQKIPSISAASIIAKVTRDNFIKTLAKKNKGYHWDQNFGYGTNQHLKAIKKLGVSLMSFGFISGNDTICDNEGDAEIKISFNGTAPFEFEYAINGINQPSITTFINPYFIESSQEGTYSLVSYSADGSAGTVSGNARITVLKSPTAIISTITDTISILDPSLHFTSNSLGDINLQTWNYGYDALFDTIDNPTREQVAEKLLEYLEKEVKLGTKVNHIMRHTVGLYHGQIGSKDWKRYLSDNMMARDSDFQKAKHIMTIVQNNEKANQLNS